MRRVAAVGPTMWQQATGPVPYVFHDELGGRSTSAQEIARRPPAAKP